MDKLPSSFSAVKIKRCAQNPKRKEPFPEITKCSMPGSDDANQRKKRKIKKSHCHYQTRSSFRLSRSSSHNNENPLIHMRRKDKTKQNSRSTGNWEQSPCWSSSAPPPFYSLALFPLFLLDSLIRKGEAFYQRGASITPLSLSLSRLINCFPLTARL